jgi:hypothetical protein
LVAKRTKNVLTQIVPARTPLTKVFATSRSFVNTAAARPYGLSLQRRITFPQTDRLMLSVYRLPRCTESFKRIWLMYRAVMQCKPPAKTSLAIGG